MDFTWIAIAAGVIVVMGLGAWALSRRKTRRSSGLDDRYTPERVLTPEQVHMLDYLQDTFPGQVVLPNVALKHILSVRRAKDRKRAEQRLEPHKVDFVVCGEDGRPSFAFDIEQYHLSNAKAKAHQVKVKNRILRTAGVRFVFLKNGLHRMPSPADFRAQLNLAVLPKPRSREDSQGRESVMQQLESQFSEFGHTQGPGNSGFRESEVMGLSRLMDLEGGSRRQRASGSGENSGFGRGQSRFDGSSMDVRGG